MLAIMLIAGDTLPQYTLPEEVVVGKAEKETPVSYTELDTTQIEEIYNFQDVPNLLRQIPGVFVYSDAGNGLNYNYMSIRGFSQKYISVLINDIPTDDVESHDIYWIDYPDILSSTTFIQFQRGVGSIPYGYSAIAGAINLIGFPFRDERRIRIYAGYGSFSTYRLTMDYSSGWVGDWNFYTRLSKLKTDGYREKSWSDMGSYYVALQRNGGSSRTTIVLHGGSEYTHLAYYGIDTATLRINRRYNPLQYDGETDLFFRPHYELHQENFIGDNLYLKNTLYAIIGKGRFRQLRDGEWREYFREYWDRPEGETPFNLIRERWVDEKDFGYLPKLIYTSGGLTFTAGSEFRYHTGDHWGTVVWADNWPSDIPLDTADYRYYSYTLDKYIISPFAHLEHRINEALTLMLGLQVQMTGYRFYNDIVRNLRWSADYVFPSPRIGMSVRLTPGSYVFVNYSINHREPGTRDIYDAQYPYWNDPAYDFETCETQGNALVCTNPRKLPEDVKDIELGYRFDDGKWRLDLNLYNMDFTNALVYGGELVDGVPILTNAGQTRHRGVEFYLRTPSFNGFRFHASLSLSDNRYVKFAGTNWDGSFDYSGNFIAYFPFYTGYSAIEYDHGRWNLYAEGIFVGSRYIDPENTYALPPYQVVNLYLNYTLKPGITLRMQINNLFNEIYEPFGVKDGEPYLIPAATRNFFVGIESIF